MLRRRWPDRRAALLLASIALLVAPIAARGEGGGPAAIPGYDPRTKHWTSPFGALNAAMGRFESLATARRPQDLPRLADPEAATVLRTIWAAADPNYGSLPDVTLEAMTTTTIELYEIGVLAAYLDFPAKPPLLATLSTFPPIPVDSDHLATLFGPELAGSIAASVAAIAHVSVTTAHYGAKGPDSAKPPGSEAANPAAYALVARAPNLGIAALAQDFMTAPAFGPENTARVAAAFADHGADFAIVLSRADRARFAASFAAIGQRLADGPARRDLGRFVDELHAAPCGPLCGGVH